jgi:hypothetical protein
LYPPGKFRKFDLVVADNDWPVFSEKLKGFLEREVAGSIQFFPISLCRPDGSGVISDYCVGDLLKSVDCVDRSRTVSASDWVPVGRNESFQLRAPIILDPNLIGEERLFRVKGYSRPIVITDALKKALQVVGFRRHLFSPIQTSPNPSKKPGR